MAAIVVKTIDGKGMSLASGALDAFRSTLRLGVSLPGEAGYEEARAIWNAMVDRRPAAVVRASHPEHDTDVQGMTWQPPSAVDPAHRHWTLQEELASTLSRSLLARRIGSRQDQFEFGDLHRAHVALRSLRRFKF